ncbi:hypothetical protein JZ751_007183 [Albula glossodonta]|uniref:Uncharacterized protein n=1 Tax=Albula glossodonta TaxID=121402 RepID=A0A8T2PDL8_9TELE|nr:hypothetical protein JZ751_007183 [Albula glossodonta]
MSTQETGSDGTHNMQGGEDDTIELSPTIWPQNRPQRAKRTPFYHRSLNQAELAERLITPTVEDVQALMRKSLGSAFRKEGNSGMLSA